VLGDLRDKVVLVFLSYKVSTRIVLSKSNSEFETAERFTDSKPNELRRHLLTWVYKDMFLVSFSRWFSVRRHTEPAVVQLI